MLYYNQYVRAESLDEAYTLYQKKNNFILAGMLWQKMRNRTMGTAIDLCALGLDQVDETETEFRIGAYVSLRELETNERLNAYTEGAFRESVRHIVGVQFRNVATVGGSLWGRFGFSDVMTIFRALGAKVELHHAGIMDLDECQTSEKDQRYSCGCDRAKDRGKGGVSQPEKPVHRFSGADLRSCKESRRICSSGGGNSSSGGSGTGSTRRAHRAYG